MLEDTKDKIHGTNFCPLSCLLTNRKTEFIYLRWFADLKYIGLELNDCSILTDMEFGIGNILTCGWN